MDRRGRREQYFILKTPSLFSVQLLIRRTKRQSQCLPVSRERPYMVGIVMTGEDLPLVRNLWIL